jgi:hypothetical protein
VIERQTQGEVPVVKDGTAQRPIPTAWRDTFREIVKAFANRDYGLKAGLTGVAPVSTDTAGQIESYISDYGATLVELPEDTWSSSVCIWMGKRWDAMVDLWTVAEGRSDLVLDAKVLETAAGYEIHIRMVYVP